MADFGSFAELVVKLAEGCKATCAPKGNVDWSRTVNSREQIEEFRVCVEFFARGVVDLHDIFEQEEFAVAVAHGKRFDNCGLFEAVRYLHENKGCEPIR